MELNNLTKIFTVQKSAFANLIFPIKEAFKYAGITTKEQAALFLANCAHETGWFTSFKENTYYTAERMAVVWPNRFRGPDGKPNELARKLDRKREAIANQVYSGRLGNGDVKSLDGARYIGRGLPMLTGRDWYTKMDKEFNMNGKLVMVPSMLEDKYWSAMAGAFFWKEKKMSQYADRIGQQIDKKTGIDKAIVDARKAWQGGSLGLKEVNELYHKIIKLL